MKRLLLVLLALTLTLPAVAAPKKKPATPPAEKAPEAAPDFSGRYEGVTAAKVFFIVHVRQTGAGAEIEFSASKADGSGAAPDGSGSGALNDKNELEFTFEDSFGNKGTGSIKKVGKGIQLTLKADPVVEPRAARLYGVIALKRTVDRE